MGTVSTTSLLRRLVDLDMLDDEIASIETFGVGVGLGVAKKCKEEFGGFDRPARARDAELLSYLMKRRCVSQIIFHVAPQHIRRIFEASL